tara:strand:+ start:128 stop:607 length:480 start_codon:yes stop_codon:yes gene_type:complete
MLITLSLIYPQVKTEDKDKNKLKSFQISSERYHTTEDGSIMMNINVWGHVPSPGKYLVYEGIDFASLLSIVGGPNDGANLKNVRLYREIPDEDNNLVYKINLNEFLKTGNRSNFIKIKPNDTIIIPQKISNYLLNQANSINTIFSLFIIYLQIQNMTTN